MIGQLSWQENTLRAGPLVNIPTLLREFGCDPAEVLRRAGLNPNALDCTEHRLSYLTASRLLARCVEATGCDHFGLLIGQSDTPSHLGLTGFLVHSASTVRQALNALVENLDLHDEGGTVSLDENQGYCRLSYQVVQPGAAAVDQICDLSSAIMCKIMRSLCGQQWKASEVLLPRCKPRDTTPYVRYFQTIVFFDSDTCSVVFPCHLLEQQSPRADKLLFAHLQEEAALLHQAQHTDVVDMLPAVMQRGLLLRRFTAQNIADAFGIQERTLHRRLQSSGTSFRQELDRVRESMSAQLLEGTHLPVRDIATSLGYSDSSSFIRAFRRWTGHNPSHWRKRTRLNRAIDSGRSIN